MATHSSILAWKIPRMEEPCRLQSMGSQRVRHNWTTSLSLSSHVWFYLTPWTTAHQAALSSIISQTLLRFMSIELMMLSNYLILYCSLSFCLPSFPPSGPFPMSWLFASGGPVGALASASVLSVNVQGWCPLGLTSLISLQSRGLSRVFSNTTVQKHQFFSTQPSLWSNSPICTWLLEKPWLWLYRPLLAKWYLCFLLCCVGLW